MARESAAERRAREANERAEREARVWVEFTAAYPKRFAALLFSYMELNYAEFRVTKLDEETYEFERKYTAAQLKVTPPANYNWEVLNDMERAEEELRDYAEERAEEARRAQVRANALMKLTAEERELLNV